MSSGQRRSPADVVAAIRRGIVGIRARASRGTGWVALGNDLIVTSQTAVGYELDVDIELDGGVRHPGRVVWADVPRDLAVVLPGERLSLPPLVMRPDLPRLGESTYLLGAVPGQPFRITPALVCAIDFRVGTSRCFELDAPPVSPGGPVVDADGQIVGVSGLDLPRGEHGPDRKKAIALPVAALQRALSVFDVPAAQLAGRMPIYRCPACTEPYAFEAERCIACGRRLPHAWDVGLELGAAERVVREALKRLSALPTTVRTGPRSFRAFVPPGPDGEEMAHVRLDIDASGETLTATLPIARVPPAHAEPFLRLLLTLNDQLSHGFRLVIDGDAVGVAFAEPCVRGNDGDATELIRELLRLGARYRKTFAEVFDAKPIAADA